MTNEVIGSVPALASETATEAAQPNAATTDTATGAVDGGDQSQVTPKTYTEQEHRDAIERATAKAAAKAERRAFREATARLNSQAQPPVQQAQDDRPRRRDGESDDSYLDRMTDWKLERRDQQRETQANNSKTDKLYAEANKLTGFDQEAFDDLPLTPAIVHALADSDVAPRLMHYMASNPEEVQRISQLPPARQAAAIGKLEAKLEAEPAKLPRTSKTPDPIGDPTAKANTTTTPSDPSRMTQEQYNAWRKQRGARWAR